MLRLSIQEHDRWRFVAGGDFTDEERRKIAKGKEIAGGHAKLRDAYLDAIYHPWLSLPDERPVMEMEDLELRNYR